MSTYVLVHGAWMGKFAWDKVVPQLQAKGHTVVAVELPAHGDDSTPATEASLDAYAQAVITAIGDQQNVILVGHSMAGMVISLVAEKILRNLPNWFMFAPTYPAAATVFMHFHKRTLRVKLASIGSKTILPTIRRPASKWKELSKSLAQIVTRLTSNC